MYSFGICVIENSLNILAYLSLKKKCDLINESSD